MAVTNRPVSNSLWVQRWRWWWRRRVSLLLLIGLNGAITLVHSNEVQYVLQK